MPERTRTPIPPLCKTGEVKMPEASDPPNSPTCNPAVPSSVPAETQRFAMPRSQQVVTTDSAKNADVKSVGDKNCVSYHRKCIYKDIL